MGNEYRTSALTESEGPTGGENARTTELNKTAQILPVHSESATNSLKPHSDSTSPNKGTMGIRGHRKG